MESWSDAFTWIVGYIHGIFLFFCHASFSDGAAALGSIAGLIWSWSIFGTIVPFPDLRVSTLAMVILEVTFYISCQHFHFFELLFVYALYSFRYANI
jgi:hypothetical protein